jgi:spermidine synthase
MVKSLRDVFPKMSEVLREGETENFKLEHFYVSELETNRLQLNDLVNDRREYTGLKSGTYVRLCDKRKGVNKVVMSDTFMERKSNHEFYQHARGDLLMGGLGLGMVLLAVQDKPEVNSVTVVEIEQEIIDLILPELPLNSKVNVVQGDIVRFATNHLFDTIYFDIWSEVNAVNWKQMKKLHRRFRKNLKADGWMSSWRKEDTRKLHHRYVF